MNFCLTPITLGANKLNSAGFLMPITGILPAIVGAGTGTDIEDVTPSGDDVVRRKIAITLPAIECEDEDTVVDLCTYNASGAKKPTKQDPKYFDTSVFALKPMQFTQKDFTNLLNCDTQQDAWMDYLDAKQKNAVAKLNKKILSELDARVGAYGNGSVTATPKQLALTNPLTGAISPIGFAKLKQEFNTAGWAVKESDIIVVGDFMATVANMAQGMAGINSSTGQNFATLSNTFKFVFDGYVSQVNVNPNTYYAFAKEAFRVLFFSQNRELNKQLGGGMATLRTMQALKTVFTGNLTGQGAKLAGRVDTVIFMPVNNDMGTTVGFIPFDLSAYYDNKCDKWIAQLKTEYLVVTDIQNACGANKFNGIMKFLHCEFVEPACPTGVTQPSPVTPTSVCVPTLGCLPITVTSIQLFKGGQQVDIQNVGPFTIAAQANVANLQPAVAAYGGTTTGSNLCFTQYDAISFNGGAKITLV